MDYSESVMEFHWDPSHIHITTSSMQASLEPLVVNVTELVRPERSIRQKHRSVQYST